MRFRHGEPEDNMKVNWILNGQGIDSFSTSGAPMRFQSISSRWQKMNPQIKQCLLTTIGGKSVTRRAGCVLSEFVFPASFILKKEPFKAYRMLSYLITAWSALWLWRKVPQSDCCITVSDYFCDIVPAMVLKRNKRTDKWIAWIHHKELQPSQRPGNRMINTITWWIQEWSFRKIARYADCAMVLDSSAGDEVAFRLGELGMPADRIKRMRNGIDLAAIRDVPESEKVVDAVMIGVRPNKGLHDIVPVWTEVQRRCPGTTLRLMGGITGVGALKKSINAAGLSDLIEFVGEPNSFLPLNVFVKLIKECRIMFAPSHEEGWGIAHCEAMACGLPVVAYDLPVYNRVYGESIVKAPCFEVASMAAKLCELLENAQKFEHFVVLGGETCQKYDWDMIAANELKLLANLCMNDFKGYQ